MSEAEQKTIVRMTEHLLRDGCVMTRMLVGPDGIIEYEVIDPIHWRGDHLKPANAIERNQHGQ